MHDSKDVPLSNGARSQLAATLLTVLAEQEAQKLVFAGPRTRKERREEARADKKRQRVARKKARKP